MIPTSVGVVTNTQVQAFSATHRRDVKAYKKFNVVLKMYLHKIRQWSSQYHVDGVERIFNQSTIVPDSSMEDYRLWIIHQAYVMSVLTYFITGGQSFTVM